MARVSGRNYKVEILQLQWNSIHVNYHRTAKRERELRLSFDLMSKFNEPLSRKLREWIATIVPEHGPALLNQTESFHTVMKSGVILCEYV